MRRIISYKLTIGETALAILDGVAAAAIGSFYPHPYYHAFCRHTRRRSLRITLKRLERRHLVGRKRRGGGEEWYLTGEGEALARRVRLKLGYAEQKRWDGKWRLVMFDVPETIRGRRNFLRKELIQLGFHQLQKSVWVVPYVLPDIFFEIISELNLGPRLRVVTAERISEDSDIRAAFSLPFRR